MIKKFQNFSIPPFKKGGLGGIFLCLLFFASCGGGTGSPTLSGGETGSSLGGAPVENAVPLPPAGIESSRDGDVYSPSETAISRRSNNGNIRIDKNGKIVGMYGVPFNPCKNKPCKDEAEVPEITKP